MRSIPLVTSDLDWPTPCCPSRIRGLPTGAMPLCRSWARSFEEDWVGSFYEQYSIKDWLYLSKPLTMLTTCCGARFYLPRCFFRNSSDRTLARFAASAL